MSRPIFRLREKKAILLDLQNTLVNPQAARLAALRESIEEFTSRWLTEEELAATGWDAQQSAQRYADLSRGKRTTAEQLEALELALQPSPFPITPPFLVRVWQRARELTPLHAQPYPHTRDALEQLQNIGYTLAIITNGSPDTAMLALHSSGLKPLFADNRIFAAANPKKRKPNAELFTQALKQLGIHPAQAVMVGNSWRNDIQGAAAVGMDSVWIRRRLPGTKKTARRKIGRNRVIIVSRIRSLLDLFE